MFFFLTFVFLSFVGVSVRLPEHQSELPDIVSIVAAMETDDLHAVWNVDASPSSLVVASPLSLLDLEAILIKEAHTINASFIVYHVDLNSSDLLLCIDINDLRVFRSTAESIECSRFDAISESELELIEKRCSFETKTIQLDGLL